MGSQHSIQAISMRCARELLKAGQVRHDGPRYLLGIVGPPAVGKSTFAASLVAAVNRLAGDGMAVAVPMDGFHLPNVVLEARGLRHLKGVPATFDAQGFVDLLSRLRENPPRTLWCPLYDRDLHDRVDAALAVEPAARLIVVEGNYLLLTEPPWDQVRPKLDLAWYLDAPWGTRLERLRQRHVAGGRTLDEAQDKISGTDAPNAELIEATRTRSDRVIWLGAGT